MMLYHYYIMLYINDNLQIDLIISLGLIITHCVFLDVKLV